MKIRYSYRRDTIYMTIDGAIDRANVEELEAHFQKLLRKQYKKIVINLAEVPFVACAVISKLLLLNTKLASKSKKLIIKGIHKNLLEFFQAINLQTFFPIER